MREEPESLVGKENASSCRPACFRARSRELDHHVCGTNTERENWSGKRLREKQEIGENWDQG